MAFLDKTGLAHMIEIITEKLDKKLSLVGGEITGKLGVNGIFRNGRMFSNVINFQTTSTVDEIVLKTKIPFQSGNSMPMVHLKGYAYGEASPIEITIVFYIYNNAFCYMGATSTCPWKPDIYLSTYTENSTKYVAISLSKKIYYLIFAVDLYDLWGISTRDYASGWSTETRVYDSTGATASVIPEDDKASVGYKSIANNISGNATTATNATTAEKLGTNAGSATQPVYFSGGKPVATTYALNKTVPSDAKFTDTVYTHPSYTARTGVPTANQTPTFGGTFQITQPVSDATGHVTAMNTRTITIPSAVATTSSDGLMSHSDKSKLNGIADNANNYTHPSYNAKSSGFYKVTVDGTGHVSATSAVSKSDITGLGIPGQDTTYSAATTSTAGLMSPADKKKLDGIDTGATNNTISIVRWS